MVSLHAQAEGMPRLCTTPPSLVLICVLLAGFSFNTVAILFILEFDNFAYVSHPDNCSSEFCWYDLKG